MVKLSCRVSLILRSSSEAHEPNPGAVVPLDKELVLRELCCVQQREVHLGTRSGHCPLSESH